MLLNIMHSIHDLLDKQQSSPQEVIPVASNILSKDLPWSFSEEKINMYLNHTLMREKKHISQLIFTRHAFPVHSSMTWTHYTEQSWGLLCLYFFNLKPALLLKSPSNTIKRQQSISSTSLKVSHHRDLKSCCLSLHPLRPQHISMETSSYI